MRLLAVTSKSKSEDPAGRGQQLGMSEYKLCEDSQRLTTVLASNPATWRYVDTVVASSFVFTKALTRGSVVIGTLQPSLATVETKLRFSASNIL